MTFLQSCWAFRGVGSFWSLRVIAFLCSVMRSVTKSHFTLLWWPPPLDFMRNDKGMSHYPGPLKNGTLCSGWPHLLCSWRGFRKSLPRCSRMPQKHRRASSEKLLQEHGRASDFLLFLSSCLLFGFLDSIEPFEMPKFDLIWNIKGSYLWPLTFKGSVYTITHTNKASPIARGSCVYSASYPSPSTNRSNFRKLFLLRCTLPLPPEISFA